MPCHEDGLGLGFGSSHLYKNDSASHGGDGHRRMHDSTELTVVGVYGAGVEVCDLGNREHCQKDEAEARDDR